VDSSSDKFMDGVSIIICCYNSADRLEPTLRHIARQKLDHKYGLEVLVIDNNSNDDTASVAWSIWNDQKSSIPFSVLSEKTPGLMAARLCGIENSKYKYIIFSDDDNSLCEDYTKVVYEILEKYRDVGILNGDSFESVSDTFSLPYWWEDFKKGFAVGRQGTKEGYAAKDRYFFWGAGISFRKSALVELFSSGFDYKLSGRKGNLLTAGEDGELCLGLQLKGYKLYYSPRLFLQHHIPEDRINEDYLIRQHRGFGATSMIASIYKRVLKQKKNVWLVTLFFFCFRWVKTFINPKLMLNKRSRTVRRVRLVSLLESVKVVWQTGRMQYYDIAKEISALRKG